MPVPEPTVPNVTLNNGVEIPQLGFGVFQVKPSETAEVVKAALEVGYRHIDTAQMYGNEAGVAQGIADFGIDPSEVFVTSKINNDSHGYDKAMASFDRTLERLGTKQVDMMLVHWPLPTVGDFVGTWKALEQIYADGRARAIGVSNFKAHHLQRLSEECAIVPAVNQIEAHPYFSQAEMREYDAQHGIATEAWAPIAQGGVLQDPTIAALAEQHGRTPAQVVLRWHIQLGSIVFPKSTHPARMRENFQIFDFELSESDMSTISSLDRDGRTGPDPDVHARVG